MKITKVDSFPSGNRSFNEVFVRVGCVGCIGSACGSYVASGTLEERSALFTDLITAQEIADVPVEISNGTFTKVGNCSNSSKNCVGDRSGIIETVLITEEQRVG